MTKIATLKDVAEKAGVTVTTVSRVINNRGYISEATRAKVFATMDEINYSPNEVARSLSLNNTRIIGVIVPSVMHPFFSKVVYHIENYANTIGYKTMICNSNLESEKEKEYLSILRANKVSGIVVCSRTPSIYDDMFEVETFPVVFLEREARNRFISICCDNYYGGTLAAEHLIEKGCKNLVMFGDVPDTKLPADLRYEGFADVCKKNEVRFTLYKTREEDFMSMDYGDSIENAFATDDSIDGIFASSDVIAARVIQTCIKAKKAIPKEVKIVGYDDISISELTVPEITTIHQPVEEMAAQAVNSILMCLENKTVPNKIILPVKLIRRGTT